MFGWRVESFYFMLVGQPERERSTRENGASSSVPSHPTVFMESNGSES
jgi:hypothetical protein